MRSENAHPAERPEDEGSGFDSAGAGMPWGGGLSRGGAGAGEPPNGLDGSGADRKRGSFCCSRRRLGNVPSHPDGRPEPAPVDSFHRGLRQVGLGNARAGAGQDRLRFPRGRNPQGSGRRPTACLPGDVLLHHAGTALPSRMAGSGRRSGRLVPLPGRGRTGSARPGRSDGAGAASGFHPQAGSAVRRTSGNRPCGFGLGGLAGRMAHEQREGTEHVYDADATADCLGDMGGFSRTWRHMRNFYIQALAKADALDVWKGAPVAFETCWDMRKWIREGWSLRYIFNYALALHASVLNNKSAPLPPARRSAPSCVAFCGGSDRVSSCVGSPIPRLSERAGRCPCFPSGKTWVPLPATGRSGWRGG